MAEDRFKDIDSLLGGLFKPQTLKDAYEKKLSDLNMTQTTAQEILGISYRTMNGILSGNQKTVDFTNLNKIAVFLQMSREEVVKLYLESLEKNYPTTTISSDKINFIKENFDLAVLKKSGFIDSITDFAQIELKIISRLGLRSIFEYRKPPVDIAFSSGIFNPKNELTRSFWIQSAIMCFDEISNPYPYHREGLIKFFPQIRWYSTNVEEGLLEVIKNLYRLGITVIYQAPLPTLKLRGATFAMDDKPCIVLTNYVGYYPTLWFALIHELYHVLFDFSEIKLNRYHLTDDSNEQLPVKEREQMADNFAREYLFSNEKLRQIKRFLDDREYVERFSLENHVHPSIVYVFHAYESGIDNKRAWARARKYSPEITDCTSAIDIPWTNNEGIDDILKIRRQKIYN